MTRRQNRRRQKYQRHQRVVEAVSLQEVPEVTLGRIDGWIVRFFRSFQRGSRW